MDKTYSAHDTELWRKVPHPLTWGSNTFSDGVEVSVDQVLSWGTNTPDGWNDHFEDEWVVDEVTDWVAFIASYMGITVAEMPPSLIDFIHSRRKVWDQEQLSIIENGYSDATPKVIPQGLIVTELEDMWDDRNSTPEN